MLTVYHAQFYFIAHWMNKSNISFMVAKLFDKADFFGFPSLYDQWWLNQRYE